MTLDQLKEAGEAPDWLTAEAYETLTQGYLLCGETPRQMYERCAKYSASVYGDKSGKYEKDFFQAIWNNWLCPATPVLSNAYTDNLQISCYSATSGNKMASIMDHFKELAMLSKYGGGVGSSFDHLVPDSGDIVPFLKMLDSIIDGVKQSKTRRGAVASYLNINHPNIAEFITIRDKVGDLSRKCQSVAFHTGVTIDDVFMNNVLDGDRKARELYQSLMTQRVENGEPYILFQDNANKNCPDEYKGLVTQSNLCLHGLTKVATKEFGGVYIKDLVGQVVTIFDGNEWVINNSFKQTQNRATFLEVYFKDSQTPVLCTETHKWPVYKNEDIELICTNQLRVGDQVEGPFKGAYAIVTRIVQSEIIAPAFCTTVSTTSKFKLECGVMTGNCSEIMAPVTPTETFVCCLSSLNLARYPDWKDHKFTHTGKSLVELSVYFLDAVISNFIKQTENKVGLENARRFAIRHRMLGLGVLGWHTLLQSKMLAFESFTAMQLNNTIFKQMREESYKASEQLGIELGCCEVVQSRRNSALLAVAPTMSNSLISGGVSQGIEPITSNLFTQKSAKATFVKKNIALERYLKDQGLDTPEIWQQINADKGSVKNVRQLSDQQRAVFLTAREINQFAIVQQAAQRQKWIDQGQSLNLFHSIPKDKKEGNLVAKYIHDVTVEAWRLGIKSLYYLKTESPLKGDVIALDKDNGDCASCQG